MCDFFVIINSDLDVAKGAQFGERHWPKKYEEAFIQFFFFENNEIVRVIYFIARTKDKCEFGYCLYLIASFLGQSPNNLDKW